MRLLRILLPVTVGFALTGSTVPSDAAKLNKPLLDYLNNSEHINPKVVEQLRARHDAAEKAFAAKNAARNKAIARRDNKKTIANRTTPLAMQQQAAIATTLGAARSGIKNSAAAAVAFLPSLRPSQRSVAQSPRTEKQAKPAPKQVTANTDNLPDAIPESTPMPAKSSVQKQQRKTNARNRARSSRATASAPNRVRRSTVYPKPAPDFRVVYNGKSHQSKKYKKRKLLDKIIAGVKRFF